MGHVSDNENFRLHLMAGGSVEYFLRHHLGSANQDEEVQVSAQELADLRVSARQGPGNFDAALEDIAPGLYSVMSSTARATLRSALLALDELPGS